MEMADYENIKCQNIKYAECVRRIDFKNRYIWIYIILTEYKVLEYEKYI